MVDKDKLNLIMADAVVAISANIVPEDKIFTDYKTVFVNAGFEPGYEHLYSTHMVKILGYLMNRLLKSHTEVEVVALLDGILRKLNTLVNPINVEFLKNYLIARHKAKKGSGPTLKAKIVMLEDCNNGQPINDPVMELDYQSTLLNAYLTESEPDVDKIQAVAEKVKALNIKRDSLPPEMANL